MSVESYFQQRAERFDALYAEPAWRRWLNRRLRSGLYERAELTLAELRGLKDFSVLDVGCGSGRNSLLFAAAGARRVLGLDLAENMIALARARAANHQAGSRVEFICCDFMRYEAAERFDAVVALGLFDYIADPVPVLQKMIARSRGKIIASFPGNFFPRAPLRKLRYRLRGCPVFFYQPATLEEIFDCAGLFERRVLPCGSTGYLVVAEVSKRVGNDKLAVPEGMATIS